MHDAKHGPAAVVTPVFIPTYSLERLCKSKCVFCQDISRV